MAMKDVKIMCLYDALIDPIELKDNPKNRNKHGQAQIERLAEIYKYQGIRHPIIVSKLTGFIVAGHGRKLAAIRAGVAEMPVVFQEFESAEQEYAFIQSDNAIALWADLDLSGINADLEFLGPDFDIDMLGIHNFTLDMSDKEFLTDENEVPEHVEPKSKLGDIYQLGDHRLMCGDSTSIDDVEKLMDGEKADMVFTDPPYGMNLDTDYSKMSISSKKYNPIIGDDKEFDPSVMLNYFSYCEELFLWGFDYYSHKLPYSSSIVWDKCREKGIDSDWSGKFGNEFELCWSKKKHKKEIVQILPANGYFAKGDEKKIHPTQKPVKLINWFLTKYESKNGLVVDLFGGSGSTLIACEKTNRKCFMMELDPHYVDVIVARWENFTGKKAEVLNV